MTDAEFMDEVVLRLNLLMKTDLNRTSGVMGMSLKHLGYANVSHFIGQLGLPPGADGKPDVEALKNAKFMTPVSDKDGRITGFEAITAQELERRAGPVPEDEDSEDPPLH